MRITFLGDGITEGVPGVSYVIVLFVGVNDVFGKLSFLYKIVKTLMRQRWTKGINALERISTTTYLCYNNH